MAKEVRERSEIDPKYLWDLTPFYADDAAWEEDLASLDALIEKAASFEGRLKSADVIRDFTDASTELERKLANLFIYAELRRAEDIRADGAQSMYGRIYGKYVAATARTAFAEPEILSLSEEELRAAAEDPRLADFRFRIEKLIDKKPHTLSAATETLLAGFGEVFAAPQQVAENLQDADMTFSPAKNAAGEEQEVSEASWGQLQRSQDRVLRENAFRSFYAGYRGHVNTFAAAYNGAVKAACAEASARNYPSSRAMSMAEEHVPEEVYDNLIAAVRKYMPLMYRYVSLRKKLLGVPELHYYDLYTPLVAEDDKIYSYEQAQQMVLDAVKPLGEEYGSVVRRAFSERWIDVMPNKGKMSGAFSTGSYDSAPYLLTNYDDSFDAVSVIAHEMGHSMHTWYAKTHQPPQYAEYTIFVAEVASTVNENLLIEQLLAGTRDPKERLGYLNQYLEGFKGTVYRQTMFAEFEKEVHALAASGEALTSAVLNGIYRKLIEDYFGPELKIDDEVQYEWARIPHFYSPFYVYEYATSYCASTAISEAVLKEYAAAQREGGDAQADVEKAGSGAVKRYLEFLAMGGSAYPLDELAHAGVDLRTQAPLEAALEKFGRILDLAEKAAEELQA